MNLKKALRIGALAAWLTGVAAYWWTFVPPPPAHLIPLHGRSPKWTPGLGDTIVLSHTGPGLPRPTGRRNDRRPPSFAPITLYDPATGEKLWRGLESEDEILGLVLKPRRIAIVHRDDVVRAVTLDSSATAIELEGVDPNALFVFAEGASIVVVHFEKEATAFDLATGQQLWSERNVKRVAPASHGGGEIVQVEYVDATRAMLRARTGLPDSRFGQFSHYAAVSEDGRRYVIAEPGRMNVYESGRPEMLRSLPLEQTGRYPQAVQLTPEGRELIVWQDTGRRVQSLTMWDCDTGEKQVEQLSSSIPVGPPSRHGTWVISNENLTPFATLLLEQLPASVVKRLQRSTMFWNVMMRLNQSQAHLMLATDTANGRTLGRYRVSTPAEWLLVADDRRGAIAFGDLKAVHCYNVPAGRDWWWLSTWGIGPVAVMWSFVLLIRSWRRRRRGALAPGAAAT